MVKNITNIKLAKYVNGHLMERLDALDIKTITLCYFDEKALERNKKVFILKQVH